MTQGDQSFPLDRSSGWKMTHQGGSDRIASDEWLAAAPLHFAVAIHSVCAPPASMATATTAWSRARRVLDASVVAQESSRASGPRPP
jgi:hypothetical protein